MSLPNFDLIDLATQSMTAGYYTLGMIEKYRPDIELIHLGQWESTVQYNWLDRRIADALENKKIACIVPWDEDISKFANTEFDNIVGWTDEINQQRLHSMINNNRELIVKIYTNNSSPN